MASPLYTSVQCTLHTYVCLWGVPWLWAVGGCSMGDVGPGCALCGSRGMRVRALGTRKPQG